MKYKIIGMLVCTLLIAATIVPMVSSRMSTKEHTKLKSIIDEKQENDEECDFIDLMEWQEFIPDAKDLLNVEVKIAQFYGGSPDLKLSIESPLGNILTSTSLPASSIPSGACGWVLFDVPDIKIIPNNRYFIVLSHDPGAEYCWCGAYSNPYPKGTSSKDPQWDYCFRTFATKSKSKNTREFLMFPGVVDQTQLNTVELHWLDGGVPHWQEFMNQGKTIEQVDLHMGCYFSGSYPITVSIEKPLGNKLTYVTYNANQLPLDSMGWVTFDFPDVKLAKNTNYYIVVEFAPGSEYAWSGSYNNPYANGQSSRAPDWDYAFRTIVDQSKINNNILVKTIQELFIRLINIKLNIMDNIFC